MLQFISTIIIALLSIPVFAQTPALLKAEGEIPKEFITPSSIKYNRQLKTLNDKKAKKRDKRNKKQFLLESNFVVDDILQSGLVLFNDPATVYVNKVLGNLPIDDSRLQKKSPRAYILNTAAVNAFATDQGIIFVTLGLLANLQNEAQLAFVLAHELMHIKHQHAINKFINSKDIERSSRHEERNIDKIALDRNLFKKSMYSRRLEEEADEEGLKIFLKTEYDPRLIANTFKALHYSYLPFEDYPFEKTFFEDEYFILPGKYWLAEVNKISPMLDDKEEEEKSSHPSSIKRLKKLESGIAQISNDGKKAFIFPEQEFLSIQTNARYQTPFLNLYAENFAEAIYTSYLMLKKFPDDVELKKVIGKALYMEAKYQNYDREFSGNRNSEMEKIAEAAEGSVHQLYNLLSEINHEELTILALKYNWNLYQQNQTDHELEQIVQDLFIEMSRHHKNLSDFSTTAPLNSPLEFSDSLANDSPEELSKFDKIEKSNAGREYWSYAFVDELKQKTFEEKYNEGLAEFQKREERKAYYESPVGQKELKKLNKKESKHGKNLGIDKIVIVNPFYLSLDDRKGSSIQFIRSEEKEELFRSFIKDLSKQADIDATLLDVTKLSMGDIDKFNDITEINNYFSQQMDHYYLSLTPGYNQNSTDAIVEKYGTDYFLWTGVISLRKKYTGWPALILSVFLPYALPFTVADAVTPDYDMLYYAILFDVTTGRRSILKMDYFNKKDSKTILKAHMYDVFQQIRNSGK